MDKSDNMLSLGWITDLYRIGQAVAQAPDRDAAMQDILAHLVGGFAANSGCLALAADDGRTLRIVAGLKLPPGVIGSTLAFGERILGWVAENGEALLLNGDVSKDTRFRNLTARSGSGIPMVALCWPLTVESRTIGVLSLNREQGAAAFTQDDLKRGQMIMNLVAIVIENARLHAGLLRRFEEVSRLNQMLQDAQAQLLQSEKMASIGQLAAGVAHEINNPVGYIASNLGTLAKYVDSLLEMLNLYEVSEEMLDKQLPSYRLIQQVKEKTDLHFVRGDVRSLVQESLEGVNRVKKIVADLKEFSHVDRAEWQQADLHLGIDSTLNIVHNELKYKAEIVKDYGELPLIECIPAQLNQVFLNLLVNAAQAIETRGTITIRTGADGAHAWVEIQDTGRGMPEEVRKRVFEPFFTTKPVGQGTGLGLSLSYNIVKKHHGEIGITSSPGQGTTFRVTVPVRQPESEAAA